MKKKKLDKAYECIYNCIYKETGKMLDGPIRWNALKNIRLKLTRGVSFDEVIHAKFLTLTNHPNRNDQRILICGHKGYFWVVPFVYEGKGIFLKTIYPSRKIKKFYEKGKL